MHLDLESYRRARRVFLVKAVVFMALGALGLSVLGLFVVFGLHEVVSPGPVYPGHDRREGAGVLCVVLLPFIGCGLLARHGVRLWNKVSAFDGLAANSGAPLPDALIREGVARGFLDESAAPEPPTSPPFGVTGRGPLLATLSGHAYGVLCLAMLMLEKRVGRDGVLFVCVPGIPLTLALHAVGVVGGLKGRSVAAVVLGALGFVAVLLLIGATSVELVFGPR